MGIALTSLQNLIYVKNKYPKILKGSILQLGRQDIYFTQYEMAHEFQSKGMSLKAHKFENKINPWSKKMVISDLDYFSSVGFEIIESLDFVPNEDPTYVHDLNEIVPSNLIQKFDCIFDGGTCEHVFDTNTAFSNIHKMLKPGGYIIHESPLNGFVDHGFYQIQPTTFFDIYTTNKYKIFESFISHYISGDNIHQTPNNRFLYDKNLMNVGFDFPSGIAITFFLAQKPMQEASFIKPVQGAYKRHWSL